MPRSPTTASQSVPAKRPSKGIL
ncbi:hypothetical protein LINPERHAP1_LOCUS38745 [Linum perenne]